MCAHLGLPARCEHTLGTGVTVRRTGGGGLGGISRGRLHGGWPAGCPRGAVSPALDATL